MCQCEKRLVPELQVSVYPRAVPSQPYLCAGLTIVLSPTRLTVTPFTLCRVAATLREQVFLNPSDSFGG
jgi:hypothetical protein